MKKQLASTYPLPSTLRSGLAIFCLMLTVTTSHAENFVQGKDYLEIKNPDNITGKKIIVNEFFWYGCSHCYKVHPHVTKWQKNQPKDVSFIYTPAPFNAVWANNSKGYYAAQELGVAKKAHHDLFTQIHVMNKELNSQYELAKFYSKYGADKKKFNQLFNSAKINEKLTIAKKSILKYRLTGVPAVVVHGKYVVKGADAKTLKVVDYLIKKVRKENAKK